MSAPGQISMGLVQLGEGKHLKSSISAPLPWIFLPVGWGEPGANQETPEDLPWCRHFIPEHSQGGAHGFWGESSGFGEDPVVFGEDPVDFGEDPVDLGGTQWILGEEPVDFF